MLTLYITRHGETVWNTQKRLQGWGDSALTESGIKNARALGERLQDVEFKTIYSSSSQRAYHTAQLICGDRNIPIIKRDDLREISLGDWEGKTREEIEAIDRENYHAFWNTPHLYTTNSGESFAYLQKRILRAINNISEEQQDGNILIVTHTVVIKNMLLMLKKLELEQLWKPPYIHDTSLTIVEFDQGKTTIQLEGDISHRQKT